MDPAVDTLGRRRAAAASEGHVAQAAREVLAIGNAVDAVVAGVLMAAADAPGVLLGPVQILSGGAGAGLLAIDGRVRQPGLDAPRPRGFLPNEPVPEAARVGAPGLPAALATALATLGSLTPLRAAGPALAWAKSKSVERARVIEAIARHGAPAMASDAVATDLVAAAGRAARGLLTPEDLARAKPVVTRCDEGPSGVLTVPWRPAGGGDGATTHVVAAADGRGLVAIACYEVHLDGVPVPALGLVAPRLAAPVLRGQPRVAPGEPRSASAPIALRTRQGLIDLALGIALAPGADATLDAITAALDEVPTIAEALARAAGSRTVAIVCARDSARALSSA